MVSKYQIAFWNLENLFDIENSPRRSDKLERTIGSYLHGWTYIFQPLFLKPNSIRRYGKRSQVQGSTFSAASDRRCGQFDQKSDAGLAESHTRVRDRDKIEDPKSS